MAQHKSRGNRVQTRALLDLHVDINDLSDYACTLAIHMTNIILNVTDNVHRRGAVRKRAASAPAVRAPPWTSRPTHPSVSATPYHAWSWSWARGRQGAAQRHKVRAQRSRKSARTGQVRGAGCAAAGLLGLIGLAKNETTPRDRSRGCGNGSPGGNSKTCEIV